MTKVLIAGAGIAGPATAIALHKAGIEAGLFEAYPGGDGGHGAFVTIPANGQDALNAIDAGDVLSGISFPTTRLRLTAPDGTLLGEFPLGGKRPAPRTVTRSALSAALTAEAARLGIPVTYGKRLRSAVTGTGGRVTVSFTDGTTADGDVLIGADGIHSSVRGIIGPGAPAPRYTGIAVATGYAGSLPGAAETGTSTMIFGSRAYLGCISAPDGRLWWFCRVPGPEPTAEDLAAPPGWWRERLAAAFDDDATPAASIIRATPGPIGVAIARGIPALPSWRRGPVTVIGDAAHPVSPATTQGVSLALEDAVTLARCLRDIPDVADALAAFEHLRRDRAERVVQSGARSGANPVAPAPGSRVEGPPAWLLDHHIDWDEQVSVSLPG